MGSGNTFRGHAGGTGEAAFFSIGNPGSSAAVLHTFTDGTGPALHAHAGGGGRAGHFDGDVYVQGGAVGIGVPNPAAGLEIDGPAKMTGFQLTAAPTAGYVLTSDATGVGTWEAAPGTIGGAGTTDYVPKFTGTSTIGNSAIRDSSGNVAIGAAATNAKLRVHNTDSQSALLVTTSATSTPCIAELRSAADLGSSDYLLGLNVPETSSGGYFIGCAKYSDISASTMFVVDIDGNITSQGLLSILGSDEQAIEAYTSYSSSDAQVIRGVYALGGGGPYDAVGVYGESKPQDFYGTGGEFVGGYTGVIGKAEPTGFQSYFGMQGTCDGGSGSNIGVYGSASGSGANYGIFGSATSGVTSWAGYFSGDVRVTGTLVNPGPELEMDHPSDPENKYLRHALVASSEMKTVYDGTVILDASGEAVVQLPDWLEMLNASFRYQLTAIGAPGPNLYVAEKISGGTFRIAGGEPGMEVSWQVTGVRQDAHAVANRLQVEAEKPADERGRYLSPEAHGASPTLEIGRIEDEKKLRKTRE
jgi:hypothetical protein